MLMWAGSIVHEVIAESLNRFTMSGKMADANTLKTIARQKLRSGWIEAINKEWQKQPKKTNLAELYYGNGKTLPKEQTENIKNRVNTCLDAFANSNILKEILTIPYMDWKPIDKLDSFTHNNLKIWCAIDFAYTDQNGILRIIDWKTGKESANSLQTQLSCYAFYAAEKWFAEPKKIRIFGIFLKENARISSYNLNPEIMFQAQEEIITSAKAMREKLYDPQNNLAKEEDFPLCDKPYICNNCNYKEICSK